MAIDEFLEALMNQQSAVDPAMFGPALGPSDAALGSSAASLDPEASMEQGFIGSPLDPFVRRGMPNPEDMGGMQHGAQSIKPLTRDEVKSIVEHEMQQAMAHVSSFIAEDRRKALSYYYGRPFGNEQEGSSQVVLTDVLDTVEWMMPTLLRMFLGGDKIWKFTPKNPEDIEGAKQATKYINHTFLNEMDGFQICHDWIKTALIEKNGFTKAYLYEVYEPKNTTYRGLGEEELVMLLDDNKGLPVAFEEYEQDVGGEMVKRFDIRLRSSTREVSLKVDGIAPEEMLVARRLVNIDEQSAFMGHRFKTTISELISKGFDRDVCLNIQSDDSPEWQQARTERFSADETYPSTTTAERADPASREVWVTECYLPIDEDGDGYAELRKITVVGSSGITILDDEEVNWMPFASLCPVPMPFKFFGLSLADLVMDIQLIRSTLLRQMLDNLYLQNNKQFAVVTGEVNTDDLLTSQPGGLVRVTQPGMIEPIVTQPLGPEPFKTLEYLEGVKENRTGVTRYNQGLDASSLNQTATGITSIMAASAARIEMIARIFANGGFKRLGKLLLRLMIESPIKERVFELNGEWITVDPSTWNADMSVDIEVGLGVGQAAERIAMLKMVMDLQSQINNAGLGGLMVTPDNVFNATERITEAMGFNMPELFFTNPQGETPDPPPPDPAMLGVEQQSQEAQANAMLRSKDLEQDQERNTAIAEFRVLELERNTMLKIREIDSRERIAMAKIQVDRQKQQQPTKETA